MFERFTDRARRVVVLAQEEARLLKHGYIGTEHILLGLIREDQGIAAKALKSLDVELQAIRDRVREICGDGDEDKPEGHIPFTRGPSWFLLAARGAELKHTWLLAPSTSAGLNREGSSCRPGAVRSVLT
jgi:ATP-dependent Clp protease ATP-binding subunit ClpC